MLGDVKRLLVSETSNSSFWSSPLALVSIVALAALVYYGPLIIKKSGFEVNKDFLKATAFYAFPLAALSATSPLIGAATGTLFIFASTFFSGRIGLKTGLEAQKIYLLTGIVAAATTLPYLSLDHSFLSAAVFLPFAGVAVLLSRFYNPAPIYAVAGQYFDAATSFAVLSGGGSEMHVLGSIFVDFFGPQGIFVMKSVVVLPATLYLYSKSDGERRLYYIFIIGFLGLTVGLSNLFR